MDWCRRVYLNPAPSLNTTSWNVLRLEKSFHNWDWYSLIWFAWLRVLFPRVVHVSLSIVLWPCFIIHYELVTMHAPWLSHCKSSWSCMNWKLGSKHLGVIHGVIPHAAKISASTRWSKGPSLRDARYVNKLFNLLSLTECGPYGHLEKDGLFYLHMDVYCRPRRPSATVIFKIVLAPK